MLQNSNVPKLFVRRHNVKFTQQVSMKALPAKIALPGCFFPPIFPPGDAHIVCRCRLRGIVCTLLRFVSIFASTSLFIKKNSSLPMICLCCVDLFIPLVARPGTTRSKNSQWSTTALYQLRSSRANCEMKINENNARNNISKYFEYSERETL